MKALNYLRFLLVLTGILLFENSQAQLVAEFSSNFQSGCAPLEVQFTELTSGGATSFVWDFGDGAGSTDANPIHRYDSTGTYDVRLYIMDGFGNIDSMVKLNYVNVSGSFPVSVSDSVRDASSCALSDGAIYLYVSGSAAPYDFVWNTGATTKDITNLSIGNYSVTITSSTYFGCSWSNSYTVGYDDIQLHAITNNPTCGSADGWINTNPTGGVPPYTFAWSDGSNFQSRSSLTEGVYVLTVEDASGCTKVETFNLLADTSFVSATAVVEDVLCNGGNDGVITLSGTGGTPLYEYGTTFGFTTQDSVFDNLNAGWHTFFIEDANGCQGTVDVFVDEPDPISIAENVTHASCAGCNDGAIDITVSGGTPPYSYLWSNGAISIPIVGLSVGMYSVTVIDANGCDRVQNLTVAVDSGQGPCGFIVNADVINTSSCNGSDGLIELTVSGGFSPYTYLWNNGDTGRIIQNLSQGNYIVQLFDSSNCLETYSYTVGTDTQSTIISTVDNLCFGDTDGVVEFVSTGGVPPYHYYLNNGDSTVSPNARIDNLPAGTYDVSIVSDNGNCTSYETFTITQPDSIQISGIVRNTSCGACTDGQVDLIVQGGTTAYTFSWSDGSTTQDLNNAVQGTYVVEVTDANGCTAQETFFVDDSVSCFGCVWPGDADYNGVANNNDVLAIGVGYGITGPVRSNASLNWVAQPANDWALALASGVNLKHSDCDGNGVIDSNDLAAINQNYGMVHAKAETNGNKKLDPALYYEFPTDTAYAGQTLSVDVLFGRDSLRVSQLYGLAFSITFDTAIVESGSMSFNSNGSWLGNKGTNLIDFYKDQYSNAKLDVAQTRIDHIEETGFGIIGTVDFTMKDDISGKVDLIQVLNLGFSNVKAISADETEKAVYYENSELVVKQINSGIQNNQFAEIQIMPNPAKGKVFLKNVNANIKQINIYDLSGSMQLSRKVDVAQSQNYELDISTLPNGVYLLETLGDKGRSVNRLVIMN